MKCNWIKRFNQLEGYKQDEILESISDIDSKQKEQLNTIVSAIYLISTKVDEVDITSLNAMELYNVTEDLSKEFNEVVTKYNNITDLVNDLVTGLINKTNDIIGEMVRFGYDVIECSDSKYMFSVNTNIIKNRIFVFRKRIINLLNNFLEYDSGLDDEIDYTRDNLNTLKRIADRKLKKEISILEDGIKETTKKTKIFDYKQMNRLAKLNNYKADRSNGDHLILIHPKSNKALVIPQHSLGRGISYKIQKQMVANSI